MKKILSNVKSKLINAKFSINLEGYSKSEVNNFLEEISALIHYAITDFESFESALAKKDEIIMSQKSKIDELTFENERQKLQITKLEQQRKN